MRKHRLAESASRKREELRGWSSGGMASEGGAALLAVEEIVAGRSEAEVRNRVRGVRLDRGSVLRVAEDAVFLARVITCVTVRDRESEEQCNGKNRYVDEPMAPQHARLSNIASALSPSSRRSIQSLR
jgi:hypothetical protein